jgi:hypothetical protein
MLLGKFAKVVRGAEARANMANARTSTELFMGNPGDDRDGADSGQ